MNTVNTLTKRIVLAGAAFALAGFVAGPAFAQAPGGDKGTSSSKVVRLNRAPVNKEILRVKLPRPTVEKLPNGLTIILLEDHKLPTVAFNMWIRPGQLADPKDLPGVASFTAGMLREGTAKRSSSQFANEVDSLGASVDATSNFGASWWILMILPTLGPPRTGCSETRRPPFSRSILSRSVQMAARSGAIRSAGRRPRMFSTGVS